MEPRAKRRRHSKPNAGEIRACHSWLEAELALVDPKLVVALGATAAQSLLGAAFRVMRERGRVLVGPGRRPVLAIIHPSAVLRRRGEAERAQAYAGLIADLRVAAEFVA